MTTMTHSPQKNLNFTSVETPIDFIDSNEFSDLTYSKDDLTYVRHLTSDLSTDARPSVDSAVGSLLERSLPPLTADEERILFRRMNYNRFQAEAVRSTLSTTRPSRRKLGKIDALLNEADRICRRIVESNLRLVASVARKYSSSSQEFQEHVSDGLLILLNTIQKFDYSRGFRFSTYATHSIQRHYFRTTTRRQRYSEHFVLTPGEVMADLVAAVEDEKEIEEDPAKTFRRLMKAADGRLNEREQAILHRRFGTGEVGAAQTLREAAVDLGISKERVRQIQIAAMDKLREVAVELNLMPSAG